MVCVELPTTPPTSPCAHLLALSHRQLLQQWNTLLQSRHHMVTLTLTQSTIQIQPLRFNGGTASRL